MGEVVARPSEHLMVQSTRNMEYFAIVRGSPERLPGQHDVSYDLSGRDVTLHPETGTCDIAATVARTGPFSYTQDDVILRLGQSE